MTDAPEACLDAALARCFPDGPPASIGIALSGGGDSRALTRLLADWSQGRNITLVAATVDHALRPESLVEARQAGRFCETLGIPHDILTWQGWDRRGNLQDAARRARQKLLADWAASKEVAHVALGHTLDDQAETVLLRLARGSGVDGLAGMASTRRALGVTWFRPLLRVSRSDLRAYLLQRGIDWSDDPSNDDPRFDRIKSRMALDQLAKIGITARGLADTADRMAQARAALRAATARLFDEVCAVDRAGSIEVAPPIWQAPADLRERLVAQILTWLGRADYRPRHASLRHLLGLLEAGKGATLHGCEAVATRSGAVRFFREFRAVSQTMAPVGALWDDRWRISAPAGVAPEGFRVAPLGPGGLAQFPDWRKSGLHRRALVAAPAAWRGRDVAAFPLLEPDGGWACELVRGRDDLRTSLLLH